MTIIAYFCLGSNSPDSESMLEKARNKISSLQGLDIVSQSNIYFTEPQDYKDQSWFSNQALKMAVSRAYSARALLENLLSIEESLGRRRGELRYGPRSIDIDLLLFDDVVSDDPFCVLPHPRMLNRAFCLIPLMEIAPGLEIKGHSLQFWLDRLDWKLDGRKIFQ